MKKVFIAILMFLPLIMSAQDVLTPQQQLEQAQKQLEEAKKAVEAAKLAAEAERLKKEAEQLKPSVATEPALQPALKETDGWVIPSEVKEEKKENKVVKREDGIVLKKDPKYLDGAISLNTEGKVEFNLDIDANGKSAQQIYDIVFQYFSQLTKGKNNIGSRMALVNPNEKVIANSMWEYIVFNSSFISLDRTEFKYQLIAKISDNHLHLMMGRMNYEYEKDRPTGFKLPAEKVITDKVALNKKKSDLAHIYGKFRKGTIDRKDQISQEITALLKK